MSLFNKLFGLGAAGAIGYVALKAIQHADEEIRRQNCTVYFCDGISEEEFRNIAYKALKKIKKKKIEISFDNAIIYGSVLSQSGLSTWNFSIDFNDYGHITGRCWIYSSNLDSNIPDSYAEYLRDMIYDYL